MTLYVETTVLPARAAAAVLTQVREVDATQPVSDIRALDEHLSRGALFAERVGAALAGFAASVALVLALVGVYASIAEALRQRRREIGIRMALGATPAAIVRLGLAMAAAIMAGGSLFGLSILLIMRFSLGQIFLSLAPGAQALESYLMCLAAALLVSCAGLVACAVPVTRTARMDPALALQEKP